MSSGIAWPALLLSLASALAAAIANVAAKVVLKLAGTRDYLSLNFALLFVLLLPAAPFFFQLSPTLPALLALVAASVIDGAANYFYFRAFELADAGTASALLSTSPLFTLLLVPLMSRWLPTRVTVWNGLGVVVTVAGIAVLNLELRRSQGTVSSRPPRLPWKRVVFPLLTALLFGANVYLVKGILNRGYANPFTYYFVRAPIIALLTALLLRPRLDWLTPRALGLMAGRAVFVIAKWLTFLVAVGLGNPVIVNAASEVTPLFVLLLALLFLKERLTWPKIGGVALIVSGLMLLAA